MFSLVAGTLFVLIILPKQSKEKQVVSNLAICCVFCKCKSERIPPLLIHLGFSFGFIWCVCVWGGVSSVPCVSRLLDFTLDPLLKFQFRRLPPACLCRWTFFSFTGSFPYFPMQFWWFSLCSGYLVYSGSFLSFRWTYCLEWSILRKLVCHQPFLVLQAINESITFSVHHL